MKRSIPTLMAALAIAAAGGAVAQDDTRLTGKERAAQAREAAEARKAERTRNEKAATPATPAIPADPATGTAATPAVPATPSSMSSRNRIDDGTTSRSTRDVTTSGAKGKSGK